MRKEQQQLRDTGDLGKPIQYKDVLTLEWNPAVVLTWGCGCAYIFTGNEKVWLPTVTEIRSDQEKPLISWDMDAFTKQIDQVIHGLSQLLISQKNQSTSKGLAQEIGHKRETGQSIPEAGPGLESCAELVCILADRCHRERHRHELPSWPPSSSFLLTCA